MISRSDRKQSLILVVPKPLFIGTDLDFSCTGVFCLELGADAMADVESRRGFAI